MMIQCTEIDRHSWGAEISPDGVYRYFLWRQVIDRSSLWFVPVSTVTFLMLNPSTADAAKNDPTIRRCVGFARQWSYERLFVVNLFAFRSSSPRELKCHLKSYNGQLEGVTDHGYNDEWIEFAARHSELIVFAWGANLPNECDVRREEIECILEDLDDEKNILAVKCLGTTKSGAPRHPLMVAKDTQLQDWRGL
jgi:hypothetical protein